MSFLILRSRVNFSWECCFFSRALVHTRFHVKCVCCCCCVFFWHDWYKVTDIHTAHNTQTLVYAPIRNALRLKKKCWTILDEKHYAQLIAYTILTTLARVYCPLSWQFKWCANRPLTPFDTTILFTQIAAAAAAATTDSWINRRSSSQSTINHRHQGNAGMKTDFNITLFVFIKFSGFGFDFMVWKERFIHFIFHTAIQKVWECPFVCVKCHRTSVCFFVFSSWRFDFLIFI